VTTRFATYTEAASVVADLVARIDRGLRRSSAVAVGAILVLLAWFTIELITSGTWYGVSQRVVFLSLAIWPIRVAGRAVRERRHSLPHADVEMVRSSV
jgi:hypothetical protein